MHRGKQQPELGERIGRNTHVAVVAAAEPAVVVQSIAAAVEPGLVAAVRVEVGIAAR